MTSSGEYICGEHSLCVGPISQICGIVSLKLQYNPVIYCVGSAFISHTLLGLELHLISFTNMLLSEEVIIYACLTTWNKILSIEV